MDRVSASTSTVYALGFSYWKRASVRLCFPKSKVYFVSRVDQVPDGAALAVWGMKKVPEAKQRNISVVRIEDGFLRSVGLGADLIQPLSWVIDYRGMYFDATRPSDLEVLLAETVFSADLLRRAAILRKRIVKGGFTKYNVGSISWHRPDGVDPVILVPGQVETDASLAYGAPGIKTNIELLQAVREANPGAYVIYKPHPDVVAGLRKKGLREHEAAEWCDEIVDDVRMGELLWRVDEVHCITSLAGFEALLRGKRVVCYGQPFYAGWGLTTDIVPILRRVRHLALDELVAGALILYPCYMSRKRHALVSPEEALDELEEWQAKSAPHVSLWRKVVRMILRRVVGVR